MAVKSGLVLPMIIGGILLTPLAAFTAKKIPKSWLGISIGAWLIILNIRTLLSAYGIMILFLFGYTIAR